LPPTIAVVSVAGVQQCAFLIPDPRPGREKFPPFFYPAMITTLLNGKRHF
jgi:hypothetical protein